MRNIVPAIVLILFIVSVVCGQTQQFCNQPESVVFDGLNNRYLVSNNKDGNIVQIGPDGTESYFNTELLWARGTQIVRNNLFVVCNLGVVGFDLKTAKKVMTVSITEAVRLNDITADLSGNLYVTDMRAGKIFKIKTSDGTYSVLVESGLSRPNGILFDQKNNRLLLCLFKKASPIQAVNLEDGSVATIATTNLAKLDGLTQDNEGNFYVSSWGTHSVYRFDETFSKPPEVFSSGHKGPADIFYNKKTDTLAVPNFKANTVEFISVKREKKH